MVIVVTVVTLMTLVILVTLVTPSLSSYQSNRECITNLYHSLRISHCLRHIASTCTSLLCNVCIGESFGSVESAGHMWCIVLMSALYFPAVRFDNVELVYC